MFNSALTFGGMFFVYLVAGLVATVAALCYADYKRSCNCNEEDPH